MASSNKKNTNIVIFGRPNVGKSTLFNRLIGRSQALVSGIAGTTRDSNIGKCEWQGREFQLIDTGGILDLKYLVDKKAKTADIESKVQKKVRQQIKEADLILFLVDAKTGTMPQDKEMAMFLKKRKAWLKKIILVANKADSPRDRQNTAEFNKLAMGEPLAVSATNGSGTGDLLDIITKKLKIKKTKDKKEEKENIYVSIIGKPNVGKSSLLNKILGYEKVIVSPEAHTTREPQNTELKYKKNQITLIDTAGISKKGEKGKGLEKYGIRKSLAALKKSDIALLVIDIKKDLTHQDSKLVEEIMERKISFLIIANKWDLIKEKDAKKYTQHIYAKFPFATWAPIHFASALTGAKTKKILDLILELNEQRQIKLGDSQLNKFLNKIVKIHKPAKAKGTKYPRIYELKQTKTNPPAFNLRIGPKDTLADSYVRFIQNRLREKYGFVGTPISTNVEKERYIHGKKEA